MHISIAKVHASYHPHLGDLTSFTLMAPLADNLLTDLLACLCHYTAQHSVVPLETFVGCTGQLSNWPAQHPGGAGSGHRLGFQRGRPQEGSLVGTLHSPASAPAGCPLLHVCGHLHLPITPGPGLCCWLHDLDGLCRAHSRFLGRCTTWKGQFCADRLFSSHSRFLGRCTTRKGQFCVDCLVCLASAGDRCSCQK